MVNLNAHPGRGVRFLVWATCALLAATVIGSQLASAQSFITLYSFPGGAHGAYPYAGLISDGKGTFYGTTNGGGSSNRGTVFSLTTGGKERVRFSFAEPRDGEYPYGPLYRAASGNLYGMTPYGGNSGRGTVFRLDKNGKQTVLHRFTGYRYGSNPYGGVVGDASGDLYGTTLYGGDTEHGTIFRLDEKGTEVLVHSFASYDDGAYPYAGLIHDVAGNLYGTTSAGGTGDCTVGCGTVFKVDKSGVVSTLYAFTGEPDGMAPYAGVVQDTSGAVYGTTNEGGSAGYGTVFKVDAQGKETLLYSFANGTDGAYPYAGLVLDSAGNLYGTTVYGGASGYGTVFEIDPSGKETVLHSFAYSDGAYPYGISPSGTRPARSMGLPSGEAASGMGQYSG